MRLSETQAAGLETLGREVDVAMLVPREPRWLGEREGVAGSTLLALERKGLATVKETKHPYRRLVGRITEAGQAELRRRRSRRHEHTRSRDRQTATEGDG